jgi:hypothetical protein
MRTRETKVGVEENSRPKALIEDFYCGLEIVRWAGGAEGIGLAKLVRLPKGFNEEPPLFNVPENRNDGRLCCGQTSVSESG